MYGEVRYKELIETKRSLEESLRLVDKMIKSFNHIPVKKRSLPDGKMEEVIQVVCDYAKIQPHLLFDMGNTQGVVIWRKILSYILMDYSHVTSKEIALRLNYANHGTVLHHRNKMREWMADPRFAPRDVHIATQNILNKLSYE